MEKGRHWEDVDHEVGDDIDDGLHDEGRSFCDTVARWGEEVPITADWTERVSIWSSEQADLNLQALGPK